MIESPERRQPSMIQMASGALRRANRPRPQSGGSAALPGYTQEPAAAPMSGGAPALPGGGGGMIPVQDKRLVGGPAPTAGGGMLTAPEFTAANPAPGGGWFDTTAPRRGAPMSGGLALLERASAALRGRLG
jgi:hypothetical protein